MEDTGINQNTERMYELMRNEANRLKTFRMNPPWPKDYVDIKKLAKAGFFYAFNDDNVHCAFCRGQVYKWDRDDDPMTEHARHFTTCPFIMGGEVGNVPLGEDPFPGPKRPRPFDVCGTNPESLPTNDQRSQQSDSHLHANQSDLDQYNYSSSSNHEQLQQSTMQENYPSNNSHYPSRPQQDSFEIFQEPRPPTSGQIHQQSGLVSGELQLNDNLNSTGALDRNSLSSDSSSSSSSNSSGSLNCKVCYTNNIEMLFLPCAHSVACLSCAQRLTSCPFCRTTITTRIRTYIV